MHVEQVDLCTSYTDLHLKLRCLLGGGIRSTQPTCRCSPLHRPDGETSSIPFRRISQRHTAVANPSTDGASCPGEWRLMIRQRSTHRPITLGPTRRLMNWLTWSAAQQRRIMTTNTEYTASTHPSRHLPQGSAGIKLDARQSQINCSGLKVDILLQKVARCALVRAHKW